MRRGRKGRKGKRQPKASAIDALPDGILENILGFLPAEEAVRTCVLARRWRHLWTSAASLRVFGTGGQFLGPPDKLREFMDNLVLGRGVSSLDLCELRIGDLETMHTDDDVLSRVDHWFRRAVGCKVQVLRLRLCADYHQIDDLPLVSKHLTRLEMSYVDLYGNVTSPDARTWNISSLIVVDFYLSQHPRSCSSP